MPRSRFSGPFSSPKVDIFVDMGNPFLNTTVDGFLKIGAVAATKTAAEETYHIVKRGNVSSHNFEHSCPGCAHLIEMGGAVCTSYWYFVIGTNPMMGNKTRLEFCINKVAKEHTQQLKKMCKEGAYWGTIAGVYCGMEYGMERVRGTRDWVIPE
ncbi:unnamed protein product [Ilex paraguariensis]|uniref:Uncharacterized protein n=1 Tax=Ilex paraguariensis TaxID=185542 RepID=A0ABC8V4L1_9AQUA